MRAETMGSGLRRVELVEHGVVDTQPPVQHAEHIVGVDESGNHHEGPFVMTAVQCPRSEGELLAELLITHGLEPWKSKSSSTPPGMSSTELSESVDQLLGDLKDTSITWHTVAGWGNYTAGKRAATSCITASKALTGGGGSLPDYEGAAAFIHDGGARMYGNRQELLRKAFTRQFTGFGERLTPVYVTQLERGDRTYPELTAADYISGYLRTRIRDHGIDGIRHPVQRIDDSWNTSDDPLATLYSLRVRNRRQSETKYDRVAAWIEGRRPAPADTWGDQPFESIVDRIQSDVVKEYLLEEL